MLPTRSKERALESWGHLRHLLLKFSESQDRGPEHWLGSKEQRPRISGKVQESLKMWKGNFGECKVDWEKGMRQWSLRKSWAWIKSVIFPFLMLLKVVCRKTDMKVNLFPCTPVSFLAQCLITFYSDEWYRAQS